MYRTARLHGDNVDADHTMGYLCLAETCVIAQSMTGHESKNSVQHLLQVAMSVKKEK